MKEFKYVLSGIILIFIIFNIDTYSSFTEIEISTLILVITICSCTGIIVNKLKQRKHTYIKEPFHVLVRIYNKK